MGGTNKLVSVLGYGIKELVWRWEEGEGTVIVESMGD